MQDCHGKCNSIARVRGATKLGVVGMLLLVATGCQSYPPIRTAEFVDLDKFQGLWYVIAHIPASIEKNAWNATELYELDDDGSVATTFRFNEGAFDGPEKVYRPRGFIKDESNAIWGMRFLWPFQADYRVLYVDPDYETTVIGRLKRDYLWIMAREREIPTEEYVRLVEMVSREGYDTSQIRLVPQDPSATSD